MKYLVYMVALIALLAAPASSYALGFEVGVGGWEQDPSGSVTYDSKGIDIVDDAEFEKETRAFGRAKLDMPLLIPNFYLVHTPMSFEGEGEKSQTFVFGDYTYEANALFETKLDMSSTDLAIYYELPFLSTATLGVLNAEVGLNVRYIDFSVEVVGTESVTGQTRKESQSGDVYIPTLYAAAQVSPTDFVALEVEYRGISVSGDKYSDIIGRLKVKPFGPLFIAAGYRQQDIDIEESGVELDMTFKGPFLEAGVQF